MELRKYVVSQYAELLSLEEDDTIPRNLEIGTNNFENRDLVRDNSVNKLSDRPSPSMNNIQNNVNVSQQYDKLMKLREFKQNIPQTILFSYQLLTAFHMQTKFKD